VDGGTGGCWFDCGQFPIPEFQREHSVSGEMEFSKRKIVNFKKGEGGGMMGPIPEFQREHGVSGEAEFS